MLILPPSVRIFVCSLPTDMRRSFDGLAGMVREVLEDDPLSGHLFVFFNKRRDRVKILCWDRNGLCLYYKRIEKGAFQIEGMAGSEASRIELDASQLSLILNGIDLRTAKQRPRFVPRRSA